jgi:hypothetical protein
MGGGGGGDINIDVAAPQQDAAQPQKRKCPVVCTLYSSTGGEFICAQLQPFSLHQKLSRVQIKLIL